MVSDSLAKPVLSLVKKEKSEDFINFAQLYLKALEDEDLELYSHEDMLRILKELWAFTEKRAPGETNITITSPLNRKMDWDNKKTSIFLATKERPFLIDSVAAEIMRHDLRIVTLMHPILSITRDKKSYKRKTVEPAGAPKEHQESILFIEVEGSLSKTQCIDLERDILSVLDDVRFATNDWLDMKAKILHTIGDLQKTAPTDHEDLQKYLDFLQYLHDDNFTLLGYREYDFSKDEHGHFISTIHHGSGLGLLHDEVRPAYLTDRRSPLPHQFQEMRVKQDLITLTKVSRNSTVHRPVPLDGIHIKMHNDDGEVVGERLFIGLFTSVTYSRSVKDVPLLRDKVQNIVERCNFTPNSHDYKALTHIMEKYPRDELFQISEEQLGDFVSSILRLQERPRVALYTREDPFKRYISCLVYIPRDLYSTHIREMFQNILTDELDGECDIFYTTLDDSPLARVLFMVRTKQDVEQTFDAAAIEDKLIEAGRPWEERLLQTFIEEQGETRSSFELAHAYGKAFPGNYIDRFKTVQAVKDIAEIEKVYETDEIGHALYRPDGMDDYQLRLKIYSPREPIPLSDVIPIMENMGLRVQSELPFEVTPSERAHSVWIHDMLMEFENEDETIDIKNVKDVFEEALHQIWYKNAEDDRLNALILSARMPWRDIAVVRAYTKYLRQANYPFTPDYIIRALTDFPGIASILIDWFRAKHDPQTIKKGKSKANKALKLTEADTKKIDDDFLKQMDVALNEVASLDQDRILRSLGTLVQHTLRTNCFQPDENGNVKTYMSFKLNSHYIDFLPQPRPAVEIFVYSPRVEGVHLRGGKIARGGIRWSDRHEDFRTEVLGLMKAQMVKNGVIVPVGAKGGFIVKNPPKSGDRAAMQEEGIACYKIFIRGLLDITDNLNGADIVPPENVVRVDGDDPYLVVAADKGTATFSDIANGLSQDYDFWLSDAFASGGSAGYDHKAMGITARGAWESVKRHFRELGHNTQEDEFDVIGVGDMGGDVFGNGMILSDKIRLVGAFNHLHIFCDPDPDAAKGFKERKRLFEGVKGWDQYDEKLLSKGGRIYSRSDKSLKLTAEIKKRFGLKKDDVSPLELMRAMLKAQTDLLWFGGIGTYIKSANESHLDVGDKANDALRVEAEQINARVIGEGANLGVTQKARIEMGKNGVKVNADFIDNSGGVDCSDHEVNIKIMLAQYMQTHAKKLSMSARNKLLEDMTDNVADLVLENNYQQSQAISLIEKTAATDLRNHNRLIQELEKSEGLDRDLESLPDEEEVNARLKEHKGLTRPELATIIAYAKIKLYNDLLDSNLPDDKAFDNWLISYFPDKLQKDYKAPILEHKLRREIVATRLTNAIVNRFGPAFVMNLMGKSDALPHEVARACFFIRETFSFKTLWNMIEGLDNKISAETQLAALSDIKHLTAHATLWFLKKNVLCDDTDLTAVMETYSNGYEKLKTVLQEKCMPKEIMSRLASHKKHYTKNGVPDELANEISMLPLLRSSCDITYLAEHEGYDVTEVAQIYHTLGSHLNIQWLHEQADEIFAGNKWQQTVKETIKDELYDIHAQICGAVLSATHDLPKDEKIEAWIKEHSRAVLGVQKILAEMQRQSAIDLSMLTMAEQYLRRLTIFEN